MIVGVRVARIDLEGASEVDSGFVVPSLHRQRDAEQIVCVRVGGGDRDGRGGVYAGLPRIAELEQPAGHEPSRPQIARIEPRGFLGGSRSLLGLPLDE